MSAPVDWETAARVAGRLAAPGPVADGATLSRLVADLRSAAATAAEHVAEISGLRPADGRAPGEVSLVRVVDRPRWARANAEMFAVLTPELPSAATLPDGARTAAGAEVGAVLALLAAKVLGQFDPYTAEPGQRGRLLLVAPNVLEVERSLGVDPSDFRLWVALHEQTHALQFAAAPWLAGHLHARMDALTGQIAVRTDLVEVLRRVVAAVRDVRSVGVLAVLTPAQREVFDEISAVMALVEGHADVMMDEVGPQVVPSVATIRASFEQRRDDGASSRGVARVLRMLLGMDLKLAQYRDGASFVRAVRAQVGTDGFNAVWAEPGHLPTAAEIADPSAWVARVHR